LSRNPEAPARSASRFGAVGARFVLASAVGLVQVSDSAGSTTRFDADEKAKRGPQKIYV
jgi:hypothetical protein